MSRRPFILFNLWTAQALIALAWLALLPRDTENGLYFGFSGSRLILMGIALALAGCSAILAWFSRRADFTLRPRQYDTLILVSVITTFLAPATILVLRALGQTSGFIYTAYADRLAPLAFWFTLSALELILWLAWPERAGIAAAIKPARRSFLVAGYFFITLAFIAVCIALTRLGLTAQNDGSWGSPAIPLLEWQILLALVASLIFLVGGTGWKLLHPDRWMASGVYLFTCVLWLGQPINPGFFATPPRAPNFEIYPFSDAQIYAQYAQSALVGNGFLWPDVPTRPLYVTFLTWLHAIAGQDYTHVIILQTLVLAAFPTVLYLLGKELGGRPLGIGLAILTALRDLTANASAPFTTNYTYSKLFFSEIPAALLLSIFTLMALRWMRATQKPFWYAFLAGGVLGLSSLIRLQSAVILIAIIPLGFFVIQSRRKWMIGSTLMILGVALALIPWLARNYHATGGLVLDNPTSQAMVLARRWSGDTDNEMTPILPGEGSAQYSSRMTELAIQSLQRNPGGILGSAASHFLNNEIGNLLILPLRDQLNSPAELLWPQHAFWQNWNSQPGSGQTPIILFYLMLLALGMATAWHKNGLPGLLPLSITIPYNIWTSLFLSSGDRFLVPVDWAFYLYLFLGLLTLAGLMLTSLKGAREPASAWISARYPGATQTGESAPLAWRRLALTAALIVFVGASIPLTEFLFPKIPPVKAQVAAPAPGEILLVGRAIYPRYYTAGAGEPGTAKLGYSKSNEARLVFFLIGEQNTLIVFPLNRVPAFFPNASDVTIIGVQEDGFVRAREIVVQKDGKSAEYMP